jgi:surface polysaccharide O-acyltransferase-like enzyme
MKNFPYRQPSKMGNRADDLCRIMVLTAIILFFGISFWMIFQGNPDERAYLFFDIVSVWLMILIVFWLFVVEEVSKQQPQEP